MTSCLPPPQRADEIFLANFLQNKYASLHEQHIKPALPDSDRCTVCGDIFCFCALDIAVQTDNDDYDHDEKEINDK